MVRAADLLLQERVPYRVLTEEPGQDESGPPAPEPAGGNVVSRPLTTPDTPTPRTHLLSNGRCSVMVTNAGGGCGACGGLAVNRWREDATRDDWGQFLYLRDLSAGAVWSAAHQPVRRPAGSYEADFCPDQAE